MGARWRRSDVWCVPGAAARRSACLSMLGPRPPPSFKRCTCTTSLAPAHPAGRCWTIPTAPTGASQHRDDQAIVLHPFPVSRARALSGFLRSPTPCTLCALLCLAAQTQPCLCTPTATLSPNKLSRLRTTRMAVQALRPVDAGRKPRAKRVPGGFWCPDPTGAG